MMQRQFSFPDPVEEANRQQRDASNPHYSVFVSASAGSGKTKLLVDRLLRLMMPWTDKKGKIHPGIQPQRIQCLTYSKSAAAEMAIRLQKKLSEWVGYTNQELDRALLDLQIKPCDKMRRAARALFAEILDLPGGMRIETNHAFCQSILQRFPLEARIIPQFKVIEEGDNLLTFKRAFNEKIDEISDHDIQVLSPLINNNHFLELLQELQQNQQYLQPVLRLIQQRQFSAYLRSCLKLDFSNKQDYLARVCEIWPAEKDIRKCLELNRDIKNKKSRVAIESCIRWFDLSSDQRIVQWDIIQETLLKKNGEVKNFTVNKGENNAIAVLLNEQADYMYQIAETINRYDIYEYTGALLNVFSLIWQHYQDIKRAQGVLHYSDLINYTLDLLDNPGAAWVLFKLDGGLEHILLDEVQDNSAEQWRIADNLSSEFFAGLGKDPVSHHSRTIFAVGDYKQSIYSFQGAKPQEFFNFREKISKKVKEAGKLWADPQLRVSFRSSQIILDFVDQVFSPENGLTGVWDNLSMDQFRQHRSAKISAPGRVDIWPLAMMDDMEEEDLETLWKPLRKNQYHSTPDMVLAECLADWIKGQIGRVPPYGGRPIRAGDILILIRKRSDFSRALIRALKMKNIPLVNLVKTQLLDQIAVQDLMVLCEVLLLPQDDLTLACVLKSPLGGLDEESLMELAGSRIKGQTLWNALFIRHLERKDWQEAWLMLSKLFARVDYVTPYALLVEILGEHRGRERFLARLGEEALEAIDELLFQAMQYEDNHIPSLQGFLYWLKQSERTIKNEAEADLDMVRIMTVHGAKGLQGRLVILPDTVNPASKQGGFQSDQVLVWKEDAEKNIKIPLYVPNKNCDIRESKEYRSFKLQLDTEESNRLLYVALTRASEWLLVCGWQKSKNKKTENTWYDYCEKAMKQLPDLQVCFFQEIWEGTHHFIENKSNSLSYNMNCSPDDFGNQSSKSIILPKWLQQKGKAVALPDENVILPHYIPSRPDGIIFGEVPSKISPVKTRKKKDPFYRGRVIHALLQYLPNYPCEKRYDLAYQWFKRENVKLSGQELDKIVHQVIQLINNPELQKLFDSDSLVEQPVTGIVNDLVITGQIDRMRILSDKILLCDFKSGQKVPDTVEMVSKIYLRQMASYWILLKEIYPYHQIEPLLIWTDALKIMKLPIALLEKYLPAQI